MIFNLVVKRLHCLTKVPMAPQIFDAGLLVWTTAFNRPRLKAMESFHQAILQYSEISVCIHRYGGTGFVFNGREIAHLHGNGLLDIELTRDVAEQVVAKGRALPHHVLGPSRWVSLWLGSLDDVPGAIDLLVESVQQPDFDGCASTLTNSERRISDPTLPSKI